MMCPRDPFHRFCYAKDQLSTGNLVSKNLVGGGEWPCHVNFTRKHYQYTLPSLCLKARAFLCDRQCSVFGSIKYPCGLTSQNICLNLEPGMNIIVYCEDNLLYPLSLNYSGESYTVNPQNCSESADHSYKLSDYPIPPFWTTVYTNSAPSLILLSRIALGEQFVSENLSLHGEFPGQARNIKYHFVEQETQSNIINC